MLKIDTYLEVRGIIVVSSQLGQFAHGIDADNAFQCQIGLQCQPAREVIG